MNRPTPRPEYHAPAMLHSILIEKQTHPVDPHKRSSGWVSYGHFKTYADIAQWFRERFDGRSPSARTLQRYLAVLKSAGEVRVSYGRMRQGMRIALLKSRKTFRAQAMALTSPRQLSLYSEPVQIPVEKPAENLRIPQCDVTTNVSSPHGHICPEKELNAKELGNKQNPPAAPASGGTPSVESLSEDRKPWSSEQRERELRIAYGLRKYLAKMPRARDPVKWDDMDRLQRAIFERIEAEIHEARARSA